MPLNYCESLWTAVKACLSIVVCTVFGAWGHDSRAIVKHIPKLVDFSINFNNFSWSWVTESSEGQMEGKNIQAEISGFSLGKKRLFGPRVKKISKVVIFDWQNCSGCKKKDL